MIKVKPRLYMNILRTSIGSIHVRKNILSAVLKHSTNSKRAIMSAVRDETLSSIPIQEEVRLDVEQQAVEPNKKIMNPRSNAAKRKRPSHRKPPKSNFDSTSPLGVMTEFEIPNMLKKHHDKVCQILGVEDPQSMEPLTIKDVMNPVRDLINDAGVLDAFNWRELKNVQVLCMSAKGDGLAIIKAPTMETILQCQQAAHEREKKEIEKYKAEQQELAAKAAEEDPEDKAEQTETVSDSQENSKKRPRRAPSEEPYRRTVHAENLPKVQIAIVPFAFPGDFVNIRVYHTNAHYVDAEVVGFTHLSPLRDENQRDGSEQPNVDAAKTTIIDSTALVKPKESPCAYFGICSGCQYQSLSYENQLIIKKEVVENAYKHFCKDEVDWAGKVMDTVASPLKYGYRTKLTPHYDIPRSGTNGLDVPRLGFGWRGKGAWLNIKKDGPYGEGKNEGVVYDNSSLVLEHPDSEKGNMRQRSIRPYFGDVLDIEDCIIGTDIVRLGMVNERSRLKRDWNAGVKSKKGVTVLLRENSVINHDEDSSERLFGSREVSADGIEGPVTKLEVEVPGVEDGVTKTCVTENQKVVSDLVDTGLGRVLRFDFIANEFFQNNNSILPLVIKYVRDNLGDEMRYLVDAYCGSGLFSVAIASAAENNVDKVLGVEISERAVEFAKKNAALNEISTERCDFIQGKAEKLFEHIAFPKEQTGVILDPPRKGCDGVFLNQLSEFEPLRIVYVSCNVHSQARDVKFFLNETANGAKYELESIRGFDFFPQTHHVESVAVLVKRPEPAKKPEPAPAL